MTRASWLLVASGVAIALFAGVPLYEALLEPTSDSPGSGRRPRWDPRTLASVESVLSVPESAPEPTLEELVEELVALKSRAAPVLVAIACGELSLPEIAPGTVEEAVHPRAIELRHEAVVAALQRFPASKIAQDLRQLCAGAPLDVSLVAVRLLGDCDDPTAIDTLLAIARGMEPIHLQCTHVREPLEGSLAMHFVRRPESLLQLELEDDDIALLIVRAASAARTTTAARWMVELLGRNRALDLAVVEELGRTAAGGRFALPDDVIARMRDTLPLHDDQMRRIAAIALGAAREARAFDDLVFLLDESDPLIVIAARRGLSEIAGLDYALDGDRWLDWRVAQDEWYADNSDRLYEELLAADPAFATRAMGEMLGHPFFRHEWAFAIGGLLPDLAGPVFATGCATLATLGSAQAVQWLVESLAREDEHERELARDALRALTGLDCAAEREAWGLALEL